MTFEPVMTPCPYPGCESKCFPPGPCYFHSPQGATRDENSRKTYRRFYDEFERMSAEVDRLREENDELRSMVRWEAVRDAQEPGERS